jgi:glutamine amidotransferase
MNSKSLIIVDYGVGNFRSVQKAFAAVGVTTPITDDPADIDAADVVILPGVGAYGDAIDNLRQRNLERPILEAAQSGKPFFGICVGMQLLFEQSDEMGIHTGLGLLPGHVTRFKKELTVPHMGWNQIEPAGEHPLLAGVNFGDFAYFAHSYYCVPQNPAHIIARTDYYGEFASAVAKDNIFGIQFHPEKSQHVGLQILKNFLNFILNQA